MAKLKRRRMGYMTVNHDIDVDIYMSDIIQNISDFDIDELEDLRDAIVKEIGYDENDNVVFDVENLEDEQKIKILKQFYKNFTWEELEKINKEYGKGL